MLYSYDSSGQCQIKLWTGENEQQLGAKKLPIHLPPSEVSRTAHGAMCSEQGFVVLDVRIFHSLGFFTYPYCIVF